MFAIFEDGSHQYRVQPGDILKVDFREIAIRGESLKFDKILVAGNDSASTIGRPLIAGAVVVTEIVDGEFHAPKLEVGKFKRRKGYRRHWGHTQKYTSVKVVSIDVPGLAQDAPAAAPAE